LTSTDLEIIAARLAELISVNPRWMKLKQAALYSSIGQKELIQLARTNRIAGFQDTNLETRPWIFDRESIDRYRAGQMGYSTIKQKRAVAILDSLG